MLSLWLPGDWLLVPLAIAACHSQTTGGEWVSSRTAPQGLPPRAGVGADVGGAAAIQLLPAVLLATAPDAA